MSAERSIGAFFVGLAAGVTVALLFAPKSGEELRESIADTTQDGMRQVRRKVRRSIEQMQDLVERGNERVTSVLNTSKSALDALADRID
jgi:gas vesicle protein